MIAPRIPSSWPIRIGFFIAGLGFIGIAPLLWRIAEEAAAPVSSEASLSWQIASFASALLGALLVWSGAEYPNPWRRFVHFLRSGDNAMLIGTAIFMVALGCLAYFVLYDRFHAACWRGPFEWIFILSCPIYAALLFVSGGLALILGIIWYFGAVHHPIIRILSANGRSCFADEADDDIP